MDFLEVFPSEIVENIFSHLTGAEILEATLISPKANNIISSSTHLLKKFRFSIRKTCNLSITRKYSQVDFIQPISNASFSYEMFARFLSQLTIDECLIHIDGIYELISFYSNSLELLIIKSCSFHQENSQSAVVNSRNDLHLKKLKTLILDDLDLANPEVCYLISLIEASNLVELGVIETRNFWWRNFWLKERLAKKIIDLVKCNAGLKVLHVNATASQTFLLEVSRNPEFKLNLDDLSLSFIDTSNEDKFDCSEMTLDLISSISSLKSLKLDSCYLDREQVRRLLSFNLVRVEFVACPLEYTDEDEDYENVTIERLFFMEYNDDNASRRKINFFMKKCSNLREFVITLTLPDEVVALDGLVELIVVDILPKCIKVEKRIPKEFRWADARSLRKAALVFITERVRSELNEKVKAICLYNSASEITFEESPLGFMEKDDESIESSGGKFYYY